MNGEEGEVMDGEEGAVMDGEEEGAVIDGEEVEVMDGPQSVMDGDQFLVTRPSPAIAGLRPASDSWEILPYVHWSTQAY